jgi:hypothetical protein
MDKPWWDDQIEQNSEILKRLESGDIKVKNQEERIAFHKEIIAMAERIKSHHSNKS